MNVPVIPVKNDDWVKVVQSLKIEAKSGATIPPVILGAWRVVISYSEPNVFRLIMQLWPLGRGSSEEDWFLLGRIGAALGAPEAPTKADDKNPNAPIEWIWSQS
jgi:hypothetical protein